MAKTSTSFGKGNPGKPKGAISKKTKDQLKRVEYVLGLLEQTIDSDIENLKPRERALLWVDLQEYVRPKLARTELTGEVKQTVIQVVRE